MTTYIWKMTTSNAMATLTNETYEHHICLNDFV